MKKVLNLLCGIVLLSACSYDDPEIPGETSPVIDGKSVKTKEIAALSAFGIHEPSGFLKSGQELIVGDRMNMHNIYRINLAEGDSEGLLPRLRTRSGGATILHALASDGRGGWTAFDCQSGRLSCAPSLLTRSGGETALQLPSDQRHLWAVRAGKYVVATGIYAEGRYLLYSPEDGQAHYAVPYPEHPLFPELETRVKAILFASNVLKARPDGGAFVCADMYSGVMDICHIDGGEVSLTRRLAYHYPRVKFRGHGDWPRVIYSKENRFGFTDVCVTDDCIYALYSGVTYQMENKNFQHCRTLLEIGWDGIVRNTRSVDASLTHLAYDSQENVLYGIAWKPKATLVRLVFN